MKLFTTLALLLTLTSSAFASKEDCEIFSTNENVQSYLLQNGYRLAANKDSAKIALVTAASFGHRNFKINEVALALGVYKNVHGDYKTVNRDAIKRRLNPDNWVLDLKYVTFELLRKNRRMINIACEN